MKHRRYNKKGPRLNKRIIGREACEVITTRSGGRAQVCVRAGKYGISGELRSMSGKFGAPISVGRARTLKKALKAAVASVKRTGGK